MSTLVHEAMPDGIAAVFGPGAIADADWARYVAAIEAQVVARRPARALVLSYGSAPTTAQRALLEKAAAPVKRDLKVAVVTSSTFVRGVVNAFTLFSPGYRAFSPERLDDALAFLEFVPSRRAEVRAVLARLDAEVR